MTAQRIRVTDPFSMPNRNALLTALIEFTGTQAGFQVFNQYRESGNQDAEQWQL